MTSPKKGRPRNTGRDVREEHVFVRCNGEEKAMIEKAAKDSGLGVGAWARRVLVRAAKAGE